jgi:hypothetical protein
LLAALAALLALLAAGTAWAHARSTSFSAWILTGRVVSVEVRFAPLDLSAVPAFTDRASRGGGDEAKLAAYVQRRLRAETADGPCEVEPRSWTLLDLGAADGLLTRGYRMRCAGAGPIHVVAELFLDQIPSHVHFATLRRGGAVVGERMLTREARSWELPGAGPDAAPTRVRDFVALGVRHVATGADHIVFVLMLLVAAASLREVAAVVTGFTLGHSVTLALAVAGGVRPDAAMVEALVGVSIAVVAVENVWIERRDDLLPGALTAGLLVLASLSAARSHAPPLALGGVALFVACYFGLLARSRRPARLRWVVAALFGTVHGLAFSGALVEMRLPRGRLLPALFGFNAGVELGQLAVVALAWPAWRALGRRPSRALFVEVSAALALAAGAYWCVGRSLG